MAFAERVRAWLFAPQKSAAPAASPLPDEPAATLPRAQTHDVAWSESLIYAASDWPKYNPDELIRTRGSKIYGQMMCDEQVKSVVRFKRDAITGRRWYLDVKPKAKPGADEVDGTTEEPVADDRPGSYRRRRVIKYRNGRIFAPLDPTLPLPPQPGKTEPPKPKPKDPEQIELERRAYILEAVIEQMEGSLYDALNGIMSSLYNGLSMTEKVKQQIQVDGKTWWGTKHLRVKPFNSFVFYVDEFGNRESVLQRWEGKEQEIDPAKFIHHVQNPDVDLHYGQSELREAYRPWFSKDIAIRFWNIHLERHASGFLIIEPEKDAPINIKVGTAEYNAIVQVLNSLSVKTGILLPNGVKARLEKPNNTDAYEKAIAAHDKAIAKALLVPNLLGVSEQGDYGSRSQASTQLEAFLWTLDAETGRLEETLNEQWIKELVDDNFGGGPYPRFCFEPISDALKLQIISKWNELVKGGSVEASDTDEAHIRELLDFPEKGIPRPKPLPIDPTAAANSDDEGKEPTKAGPPKPADDDKTIVGKGMLRTSKRAFSHAVKRVDFAVIERRAMQIEERFSDKLDDTLRQGVIALKNSIRAADVKANPELVADLALPAGTKRRLNEMMRAALQIAWDTGIEHAQKEIRRAQGQVYDRGPLAEVAEQFLTARALSFANDMSENVRKKVAAILYSGIKNDWTVDEMVTRIDDLIDSESIPQLTTAVRTFTFEALNEARYDFFTQPALDSYVVALEFSAIIDGKTTDVCQHMDGKTYPVDSDVWGSYSPPLHFNCRSLLIPITKDDNWQASDAPSVDPADGFGA